MNNHFECTLFKFEQRRATPHTLVLEEITAEERKGKELLGKADGRDLQHCVYLGARHGESFLERVRWYYLSDEEDALLKALREKQLGSIRVEFYGEEA